MKNLKKIALGILGGGEAADTTAPTVTITCNYTSPTPASPLIFTYTWSENVTGFATGDAGIANGTKGTFTAVSAKVYTLSVVPNALATVTATVAAGVCTDLAGNANLEATPLAIVSTAILVDEFLTDDDAPMTTPRTPEPGPGGAGAILAAITDAYIASGVLNIPNPGADTANWFMTAAAIAHAGGRAFARKVNAVYANTKHGWDRWYSVGGEISVNNGSTFVVGIPATGIFTTVLRASPGGAFYIVGSKLYFVGAAANTAAQYAFAARTAANRGGQYEYFRVADLGAPWATYYGLATSRTASPSANATLTAEADAIVEMTWTAVTNEVFELSFRRTDDDNRWIARCDQAGSTIKLIQREGGVETERASTAQTFTNGTAYRVIAIMDTNSIALFVGVVAKGTYASATFNNTATGVKTDKAGTDLIAWPRNLSGTALTELEKLTGF